MARSLGDWPAPDAAIQGQVTSCIRQSPCCLQSGRTPLHLAAIQGHANAVLGLLTHNADPNLRDDRGMTALHKAAALGHTGAAEDLLKAKADPERKLQVGTAAGTVLPAFGCWAGPHLYSEA